MTQPAKAQEPSMEEILASIRRIIADDDAKPATQAQPQRTESRRPDPAPVEAARPSIPQTTAAPTPVVASPMPAPKPAEPVPAAAAPDDANSQDDIDAMFAGNDVELQSKVVEGESPAAPTLEDDVLELTEQMTVAEPRKAFRAVDPNDDIEFSEPPAEPVAEKPIEEMVRARVMEDLAPKASRPLMSQSTMASVDSAFNTLAQTVLSNNARTLEDLVREMLRPMLKSWLDDNLPGLVEKIVRAEIERVSRGR